MYRYLDPLASAALQTGIRAVISSDIALSEHRLDSVEDNVGLSSATTTWAWSRQVLAWPRMDAAF
jgi:hypothetical protein